MKLVKSPLNYVGGKYKLLPQLLELFPKDIDTFVDLFAGGGGNVSVNVNANRIIYNDSLTQVTNLLNNFACNNSKELIEEFENVINEYSLSSQNKEGYLMLRENYNSLEDKTTYNANILLYMLICHSFNNQIRFNKKGGYNMPFGKDRSWFNDRLKNHFLKFVERLHQIHIDFKSEDFRSIDLSNLGKNDFLYADPPYSITLATYNENGGWTDKEDIELFNLLDSLDDKGVKFALSNVLESKGKENVNLKNWAEKYTTHYISSNYSNCNHHRKSKDDKTIEVLITNY